MQNAKFATTGTVFTLFQLAAIFLLFVKRHWFQIKFTIGQTSHAAQ